MNSVTKGLKSKFFSILAFASIVTIGLVLPSLSLSSWSNGSESNTASRIAQRHCGNVTFAPDPYGASGEVSSSRNVSCERARRIALNCGKRGKKPRGWDAVLNDFGSRTFFYIQKGNRYNANHFWWVQVYPAGAGPPKLDRCLS